MPESDVQYEKESRIIAQAIRLTGTNQILYTFYEYPKTHEQGDAYKNQYYLFLSQ